MVLKAPRLIFHDPTGEYRNTLREILGTLHIIFCFMKEDDSIDALIHFFGITENGIIHSA